MRRLIIVLSFVATAAAHGGVVIQISDDGFPNGQSVLFGGAGLSNSGPLIEGRTSVSGELVTFRASENIFGESNDIYPSDGSLRALQVYTQRRDGMENLTYRLRTDGDAPGTITFTVDTVHDGQHQQTLSLRDGDTFRIFGTEGTRLGTVSFVSSVDVERLDHVQVGTQAVPEPATLATMGLGLAGVLRMRRRRR